MQQIRAIIQLLEKGYSLRAIAVQLSISRQSVTLYALRLKESGHPMEVLRQLSDAALSAVVYEPALAIDYSDDVRRLDFIARTPYFLTELKRTGVTRLLLWEEYRKEYDSPYRYTRFCDLLKEAIQLQRDRLIAGSVVRFSIVKYSHPSGKAYFVVFLDQMQTDKLISASRRQSFHIISFTTTTHFASDVNY